MIAPREGTVEFGIAVNQRDAGPRNRLSIGPRDVDADAWAGPSFSVSASAGGWFVMG